MILATDPIHVFTIICKRGSLCVLKRIKVDVKGFRENGIPMVPDGLLSLHPNKEKILELANSA